MPNHRKYHKFDPVELHELYWDRFLPTTKIGEMFGMPPRSVLWQLRRYGINVRKHTQPKICKVEGCNEPAFKIEHKLCRTGSYGRMCRKHRREHYSNLSRELKRKLNSIPAEKYKWWQYKYPKDERVEPWKQLQKAKRSLKSLRQCVADLEVSPSLPLASKRRTTSQR